ncbi:2-Hydroxyacid oxidase 1-like [Haliotis rufescens]|uniref:2-Hydroxyacid oxidase 1-like n=1 Tax=Haliotis rufescens TaxID=6454 RepID=UPI00201E7B1D|nr:2-Hydroxyacid oxidase 1-like [Haliotis rufescens]
MATEPVCVEDFQKIAEAKLSKSVREYYNSGANYENTYKDNRKAFGRYKIRPKYMRDVSNRSMATTILGQRVDCPIGVSPVAMCRLAHPDGEVAVARACAKLGRCFMLSTMATAGLDEIEEKAADCLRWFQIHIQTDRDLQIQLVQNAERAGFKALALTVDCQVYGRRHAEMRSGFILPAKHKLGVLEGLKSRTGMSDEERKGGWSNFLNNFFSSSATWDDLRWLKTITKLPVIAKGVITGEGAREALAAGADAIVVSNHGGRELDCVPATMDALREVVEVVGDRCEIYLDGGVRSGLDALKAIAMGARAVFVGRPILWGLAHAGGEGAEKVLQILGDELNTGMALAGASKISEISRDMVVHKSYYSSKL